MAGQPTTVAKNVWRKIGGKLQRVDSARPWAGDVVESQMADGSTQYTGELTRETARDAMAMPFDRPQGRQMPPAITPAQRHAVGNAEAMAGRDAVQTQGNQEVVDAFKAATDRGIMVPSMPDERASKADREQFLRLTENRVANADGKGTAKQAKINAVNASTAANLRLASAKRQYQTNQAAKASPGRVLTPEEVARGKQLRADAFVKDQRTGGNSISIDGGKTFIKAAAANDSVKMPDGEYKGMSVEKAQALAGNDSTQNTAFWAMKRRMDGSDGAAMKTENVQRGISASAMRDAESLRYAAEMKHLGTQRDEINAGKSNDVFINRADQQAAYDKERAATRTAPAAPVVKPVTPAARPKPDAFTPPTPTDKNQDNPSPGESIVAQVPGTPTGKAGYPTVTEKISGQNNAALEAAKAKEESDKLLASQAEKNKASRNANRPAGFGGILP